MAKYKGAAGGSILRNGGLLNGAPFPRFVAPMLPRIFMVFGLTITVMLPLVWAAFTPPALRLPSESADVAPGSSQSGSTDLEPISPNKSDTQPAETGIGTGSDGQPASETIDVKPEPGAQSIEHRHRFRIWRSTCIRDY